MNIILTQILEKLSLRDKENITKDILAHYRENGYTLVHFLYFATIILNKLDQEKDVSERKSAFIEALEQWDFLLPDGIALGLLYKKHFGKELPNLNGTDFLPFFLSSLGKDSRAEVIIYGGTETVAEKSASHIRETFNIPVLSIQHGFSEFDWSTIPTKKAETVRIMLIGRGSPLQEIWAEKNREQVQAMGCLVFTVGGLLDFFAGTEKRAPEWMRSMKIEWLYRALSNPRKNLKKTLVSLQLLKFLIQ